jgi:2-polyprenyl-3-methyl-5-hydroxy-6-metoxy-1,4-benzoquinol methylase
MFRCSVCNYKKFKHKLDLGKQPIVHHLLDSKNERYNLYNFRIVTCEKCAHLQIEKPFNPQILYKNYLTLSSWKNNQHVSLLINKMTSLFDLNLKSKIFEIGCNDGHMLADLKKKGYDNISGIEPAQDTFNLAKKKIKNVYNDFFSKKFLKKKKLKNFDLIYSRHVFEHLHDLNEVLEAAHSMLKKNGSIMIEVPAFDMYLQNYDYTFWEEHVNYFTKNSLFNLLSRNKFRVFHYETTLFSGKAIIVFAEKYDKNIKYSFNLSNEHKNIKKYFDKFLLFKKNLYNFLKSMKKKPFIYGCGSRSSNFVNFFNIKNFVDCFVDDNHKKQNKINPLSLLEVRRFSIKQLKNRTVLLGVNSENEYIIINKLKKYFKIKNIFSILPPSRILPSFWKSMIDNRF